MKLRANTTTMIRTTSCSRIMLFLLNADSSSSSLLLELQMADRFEMDPASTISPYCRVLRDWLYVQKRTGCEVSDTDGDSNRPTDTKVVEGRHELFLGCLVDAEKLALELQVRIRWNCSLVPLVSVSLVGRDFDSPLSADAHSLSLWYELVVSNVLFVENPKSWHTKVVQCVINTYAIIRQWFQNKWKFWWEFFSWEWRRQECRYGFSSRLRMLLSKQQKRTKLE